MVLPEAGAVLRYEVGTASSFSLWREEAAPQEVWFDLDQLELPLFIRSRAAGDRLEPFGLNGSKKVKDMFIDAKLPPSNRDRIPLLVDASGQILWIAGFRRSQHALVREHSERVLHVKLL
ncbi:tRNA lysidine(34) synthetase TilS [Paenibacillus hexagrammi]|uniref:tRNA lysidine(34) synthetase TilS n=2 Tax=Paenibacillus hexagrammi TaxID=2908839 RepID=A0ABY3SRC8_9BACL|nr:tRNA lysidine(34) synthetase TilS [Paenibacillus sp. YPD9-1]